MRAPKDPDLTRGCIIGSIRATRAKDDDIVASFIKNPVPADHEGVLTGHQMVRIDGSKEFCLAVASKFKRLFEAVDETGGVYADVYINEIREPAPRGTKIQTVKGLKPLKSVGTGRYTLFIRVRECSQPKPEKAPKPAAKKAPTAKAPAKTAKAKAVKPEPAKKAPAKKTTAVKPPSPKPAKTEAKAKAPKAAKSKKPAPADLFDDFPEV